jgi:hypothetical protein
LTTPRAIHMVQVSLWSVKSKSMPVWAIAAAVATVSSRFFAVPSALGEANASHVAGCSIA